jgi:hypothetical protein
MEQNTVVEVPMMVAVMIKSSQDVTPYRLVIAIVSIHPLPPTSFGDNFTFTFTVKE